MVYHAIRFWHRYNFVHRTNAPWGLAGLSQSGRLSSPTNLPGITPSIPDITVDLDTLPSSALTFSYTYDASAGRGVDIYVVGKPWVARVLGGPY